MIRPLLQSFESRVLGSTACIEAAGKVRRSLTGDNLEFDSLDAPHVLVTGFFRWQGVGAPDTSRYIYASVLEAVDSGFVIRFEHETAGGRP